MNDRSERPAAGRPRVVALLLLLAVFAAGMLAGVALDRVADAAERPPRREELRGDRRGPPIFAPGGRLAERLELTDEQQARIETILAEDRAKADSIFQEMRPRLRARFDSTNAAIREVLTPEQREEFDRWRAERRSRMHVRHRDGGGGRHGERPPPPPPPPADG